MRQLSVVLFGGTGFIGSHLAARLSERGVALLVPTRHETHADHLKLLPDVDVVEANIHDEAVLRKLVSGRDAAINLVGVLQSHRGTPYGPQFLRAHVELPRRIAHACARTGVPRLLHMSALGASRDGPSMYQRSKADGEAAAGGESLVAATIFRPSVVFGPGDNFLNMFARLQRHFPVIPLAGYEARFQPVYVGDVVEAFGRALFDAHTARRIVELGGPNVYTLGELVRLAGRYSGHERTIIPLPDAVARMQATFFEMLPGTPLISRDNLDSMKVDNVVKPSNQVLTAEALGIKLTALEAVAPSYLAPGQELDNFRARARHAHPK